MMNELDIKSMLSDLKTHGITLIENQFSNQGVMNIFWSSRK